LINLDFALLVFYFIYLFIRSFIFVLFCLF